MKFARDLVDGVPEPEAFSLNRGKLYVFILLTISHVQYFLRWIISKRLM